MGGLSDTRVVRLPVRGLQGRSWVQKNSLLLVYMQLEPTDSRVLSDRLLHAARGHRQALHTLALLLVELVDGHHLGALGYASLGEYAAKVLDLPPRQVKDLLRIGRALPGLPKVAAAMQSGALDWTKVRELVRVATPETEAEWVTRAGERTSRVLEQEVAHSLRGDLPPETGEPQRAPARHLAWRGGERHDRGGGCL
jgi:hypothetical protein